ncbi:Chlorovirus glycoprotein repeat domain-containing protein [Acanthocystis turfacea Chlorella virus NE-JV-3]|nr:Chlorovirus glycoprotein repeat domain-containing protein [Acanthocystis turfacea Chlorella virus NE-JV-3]
MSDSTFKKDLLKFGGINASTGNQLLKGNIGADGNGSWFRQLTVGQLTVIGNAVIPGLSFNTLSVEGNVTVAGQVNVTGNIIGNYFLGNGALLTGMTTTSLPATANIDITGNITGSFSNVSNIIATFGNIANVRFLEGHVNASGQINALGNIVAPFFVGNGSRLTGELSTNALVVSGNVIGNLTMAPNTRIFGKQTQFMWNAPTFGSPIIAGNNIPVATAQGVNGIYDGTQNGWRFVSGTNQYSSLAWDTGFDFTKDFELDLTVYSSSVLTGYIWVSVGGNTNGSTSTPNTVNNGALTAAFIIPSPVVGTIYYNTAVLSNSALHATTVGWQKFKVTVDTIGTRRYITFQTGVGETVEAGAEITFWNPTGSFLTVGSNSSAASSFSSYLGFAKLAYL